MAKMKETKFIYAPIDSIKNTIVHYAAWLGKVESEKSNRL